MPSSNGNLTRGSNTSGSRTGMRYHNVQISPVNLWVDEEIRPDASENSNDDSYVGHVFSNGQSGNVGGSEFKLSGVGYT